MTPLARLAFAGALRFQAVLAFLLFASAGTWRYPEGWVFWGLFGGLMVGVTAYFLRHDPALIARRLHVGAKAETRPRQKAVQAVAGVLVLTLVAVSALERRFHGPVVPWPGVAAADVVILLAYWVIFRVFRENSHTAAVVRVEAGQRLIDTGPYSVVRHPMYSGSGLLFLATPAALGSVWGLPVAVALVAALVLRLIDEERLLEAELPGYTEYRRRVRSRLVPGVW